MRSANAAWLLGCRVGADLLSFALFLIVSRRFGPEGLGAYAYGFAIAGVIYAATTSGIEEYGVREFARRVGDAQPDAAAQRSRLISNLVGTQACVAAAALAALAAYLALTQPSGATLTIVVALSVYQIGSAFAGTLFAPAMAAQQMMEPAVIELLCRVAAFAAAGALILIGNAPLYAALSVFAPAGALMAALAARSARVRGVRLRPRASREVLREGVRELWPFALVNLGNQLFTRIGVIVLSLQASAAAAGVYATGLKLVETLCLPIVFMGVAAYPQLSQAYVGEGRFADVARRVLVWGLALTLAAAIAMYAIVPSLVTPMLGPRFEGAQPVVAAMAALLAVQGVEVVLGRLLLAANQHRARAAALAVGAALCIAATIAATPVFGVYGALSAAVGAYLFVNMLYALRLRDPLRRGDLTAPPLHS